MYKQYRVTKRLCIAQTLREQKENENKALNKERMCTMEQAQATFFFFFWFVFLFKLKIEHNAYFCVETNHQRLNKPDIKNINIIKALSSFQFFM